MDSPAQPPRLPQEVLDIIIDDNTHDQASYKSFSLVSTSFLYRSRRHFFREITFSGDSEKDRAMRERFLEMLNKNPDIASYVRKLHVQYKSSPERPWIEEEKTIQEILLILAKNHISELTLEMNLFWKSFPDGLKHALTQILTTPTLVKVTLLNIKDLPVSACAHFPRLQHLFMRFTDLTDSEECNQGEEITVSISSLTIIDLRERSAQCFRKVLGLGTTRTAIGSLEKLEMAICDAGFTQEMISAFRRSLRHLIVDICAWSNTDVISFSEIQSLDLLELKFYLDDNYRIIGVLRVLESCGPIKKLRSMRITLQKYTYHSWVEHFARGHTALSWGRLGNILSERFSGLEDVVIELLMFQRDRSYQVGEEEKAALERSVRSGLSSGGGNFAGINRVLVEISVQVYRT